MHIILKKTDTYVWLYEDIEINMMMIVMILGWSDSRIVRIDAGLSVKLYANTCITLTNNFTYSIQTITITNLLL